MERDKQIEEMAKVIHDSDKNYNNIFPLSLADCLHKHGGTRTAEAVALYEAGYRKQSEGEWRKVYQNDKATVYECSNCHHLTFGTSDYCICGARMKGGESNA